MLANGLVVAGRYRLGTPLGQGAMGEVWSATHTITKKLVAIKFLKDAASAELVGRFILEAQAASAVRHSNVVGVHDVLNLEEARLALVMDYFEGESLAARLEREGPLPVPEVASLMSKLISAVAAVHAAGIVHRDLKPQNILIARLADGHEEPMLLDFGICKLKAEASDNARSLTAGGRIVGTPGYMAPEQALAQKDIDAAVDVWALGVITYEALAGHLPFAGNNLVDLVRSITLGRLVPLSEVAAVPEALSQLVMQMLTRERCQRLADLRHAQAAFSALAGVAPHSLPVRASQRPAATPPATPPKGAAHSAWNATTLTRSQLAREVPPPRRSSSWLGRHATRALGATCALLVGALLVRTRLPGGAGNVEPRSQLAPVPVAAAQPTSPPQNPATDSLPHETSEPSGKPAVTASASPSRTSHAPFHPPTKPPPPRRATLQDFGGRR